MMYTKLSHRDKMTYLKERHDLTQEEVSLFSDNPKMMGILEHFIEQPVSLFPFPMAVVPEIIINNKQYTVPLVTEETSVVAALFKMKLWIKKHHGIIKAASTPSIVIGQIQFPCLENPDAFAAAVEDVKQQWITFLNENVAVSMVKRGGGVVDITAHLLKRPDSFFMGVIHLHINVCDAMGANTVTQACEFLKPFAQEYLNEKALLCIVSNYSTTRLTRVSLTLHKIDPIIGKNIEEASLFALLDPHRAATHNKGIMNGIDAVILATGNDHRAVEAALHSYAARDGSYKPLSTWCYDKDEKTLTGTFEGPIPVGIVGGMTTLHPYVKVALKILSLTSSSELSNVMGSIGLMQNLAALYALTTDGLSKGHMLLHLTNLMMQTDATEDEKKILHQKLREHLRTKKNIHYHDVVAMLETLRTC